MITVSSLIVLEMAKQYYKNLKIIGKEFCIYNTNKTAKCNIYAYLGALYFRPQRINANNGITINGVSNLVACMPFKIGRFSGYKEIIN